MAEGSIPGTEESGEMISARQELLMKATQTIPSGEHLTVGTVMKSDITVSSEAKLTVEDILMKSKVTVKKGGSLELIGENMGSEIIIEE